MIWQNIKKDMVPYTGYNNDCGEFEEKSADEESSAIGEFRAEK